MKKEVSLLLSDYAYENYIYYIQHKFLKHKQICFLCYKNLLSSKTEYDTYINEFNYKTLSKVLEDYHEEYNKIIIASSFREPDERQKNMKENFMMLGFSGDYIVEICEEMKEKPKDWLLQEELRLKRKYNVIKFVKQFSKKFKFNLKIQEERSY